MKCEATECGITKSGLKVLAVTDVAGSQVVVTDEANPDGAHLLSQSLENHKACVALGREVQYHGIEFYDGWRSPLSLFEFACLCAQSGESEVKTCH